MAVRQCEGDASSGNNAAVLTSDSADAAVTEEETEEELRDALCQIPLLAPWTGFVAHDASFTDDLNEELKLRVHDLVFCELESIYKRLATQQRERDAAGMLPKRATRTLLESRLVVEAKRKIDVHAITANVKTAMATAAATLTAPTMRARRESANAPQLHARPRKASAVMQMFMDKRAEEAAARRDAAAEHAAVIQAQEAFAHRAAAASSSSDSTPQPQPPLLSVQFPKREQTLTQGVLEADAQEAADPDAEHDHVLHFRNRPVAPSAVSDAGHPVARREPSRDRVRYILSTRLGALPPTKHILDEYPVPKAILDALEAQRHVYVDASSLTTSFEAVPTGAWECYVRRAVPVERKPISFVLAALQAAREQPVAPPSDIFYQHVIASATNDDVMLTDVRQLYDHTHESYREFRATLHQHLDVPYLVDLSFRSSLNSTNYVIDDDDDAAGDSASAPNAPSVCIPERLLRSAAAASATVSKWRVAKRTVNRMALRRGAIAHHVATEASAKLQRAALLNALCTFTPREIQLMELWYTHDPDADASSSGAESMEPVPMAPALSARFDAVWHALEMPVHERLDLAVKYSAMTNSTRLADAVVLWETAAALVREREELLEIIRSALAAPTTSAAGLADENAMLQDLATCTANVKDALMLTYLEVGDFVTLSGNFYLARMEHEATELRRILVESMELMKRRSQMDEHVADAALASPQAHKQ